MQAAVLGDKGIEMREVPQPRLKPNEILVRVRASGLNRESGKLHLLIDRTFPLAKAAAAQAHMRANAHFGKIVLSS